jgi:hypothetical protein
MIALAHPSESGAMQATRTIALAMFQYANDNDKQYPDGKSSTELFQKLMDGNYITDPAVFFVPLPGKIRAAMGAKLKPVNVTYDDRMGYSNDGSRTVPKSRFSE